MEKNKAGLDSRECWGKGTILTRVMEESFIERVIF